MATAFAAGTAMAARPVFSGAPATAKRSAFFAGASPVSAAPRAHNGALLSARARLTIEARAAKTSAGAQIQVWS